MYTGIYFLIEAIFYSILLMIVYFRKKVFNSKENRVYSVLVVISFFELLLEFVLDFVGPMYLEIPKVSYFIARMYSLVVELWITILLCYVIFVCLNMTKKEKYIPLVKNIVAVLMIMFATLNFVLPLNFMYDGYIAYTYGPSVNIIYISAFLYSFIGIVTLIINIKNIRDRRFFPILLFLILGGIASYIQYVNPGLLLATPIHAFITFIMYFTIENPDVKMIEQYHPDWKAEIVGDGKDMQLLKNRCKNLGLRSLSFVGYQSNVINYYQRAKMICVTSWYEGWPMVIVEGMANGCVPIVYDTYESIRDIFDDGVSGLIVESCTPAELFNKLNMLMTNSEKYKSLSNHAIEKVQQFTPSNIVDDWEQLYQEIKEEKYV